VVAFDSACHGHSSGPAGAPLGFVDKFDHLCEDLAEVVEHEREKHPGIKLFVYGESAGGAVVILQALKWQEAAGKQYPSGSDAATKYKKPWVDGLILCSSMIKVDPKTIPPAPIVCVVKLMARLFPRSRLPPEKEDDFGTAFGDKRWEAAARDDPLVPSDKPPTLAMAAAFLNAMSRLQRPGALARLELPFLALHAKPDVRCAVEGSQMLHKQAASTDKELRLYEQGSHQLLQDSPENTQRAIRDIHAWLEAHC